jgi:sugar/nucleoside kinase (ribokinase family)
MAQADLLLPNEAEALRLSGRSALPGAVAALGATGARLVIKLGARGAMCVEQRARWLVQPPEVTPVDTTGAGDCFNAGLLAGLLDGLPLPRAAALGCAVGAASTRAVGGTGATPRRAEALQLAAHVTVRDLTGDGPAAG